jgi:4-hydroxy-tetrahydrodipicolinate synthase
MGSLGIGVWGVLATPFTAGGGTIDEPSLRREVELYVRARAVGLTVLGVFGEAAQLTADEQGRVLEVVRDVAGGLPLVVGLPARSLEHAVEQARRAADVLGGRLHGVMVLVRHSSAAELKAYLTEIHERTGLGIVVQDYPLVTDVRISADALVEVVTDCPFVVGVKSESPPTLPTIRALTEHTDVPVFGGLGGVGLLDELASGASGAMTGFAHPEGLVATVAAWQTGGFPAAREAFLPWLPLANFEAQPGISLSVRKELLRERGILEWADVRAPAATMPAEMLPLLRQHAAAVAGLRSADPS